MALQLAKKYKVIDNGIEKLGRLVEVLDDGHVMVYITDRLNHDKNPMVKVAKENIKEL